MTSSSSALFVVDSGRSTSSIRVALRRRFGSLYVVDSGRSTSSFLGALRLLSCQVLNKFCFAYVLAFVNVVVKDVLVLVLCIAYMFKCLFPTSTNKRFLSRLDPTLL